MGTNAIVTHYWDHQKVIKAIEKCSLQSTFGPEVTSTRDLLPKKANVSSDIKIKASHDDGISPVKEHALSNTVPLDLAKNGIFAGLLRKRTEKMEKVDHITPNSIPRMTNARGNIPSEVFANGGSMPALSTFEGGITAFAQSTVLGQVPAEVWDQKVKELREWTGTQIVPRDIHDLSYSNHKHPNHDRVWDAKNLFCIGCSKNTMMRCQKCERYCCFWSICKDRADARVGILPQERVQASQWLHKIARLVSYGIDKRTFIKCFRCRRFMCPKCTSICELCDAFSCPDCCSRCPICQIPKCIRCKPNRMEECSYHKGPPRV